MSSLRLHRHTGDLLTQGISLAHCVSACLTMGKGVAVQFKTRFQRVAELKRQQAQVGQVAVLPDQGRFVYYLVTKEVYHGKPTYATLERALMHMKAHMVAHGVTQLAIPELGCGLDRLQWPKVEALLHKVFSGTEVAIHVYVLP